MIARTNLRLAVLLTCATLLPLLGIAQNSTPAKTADAAPAVVMFDLAWDAADPPHYAVAVENNGNAVYRSDGPPEKGAAPGDPYVAKFTVTEPMRSQVFELAKVAGYFKGDFDFTRTRIANTGTKTLTYLAGPLPENLDKPSKRETQATYNWSQNTAIQQLTRIFQGISASFELGRRLDFKRRFDKLALEAELKSAEEAQKRGDLQQLQVIAPVLRNIANDVSVMHIARERAKRLLSAAQPPRQETLAQ